MGQMMKTTLASSHANNSSDQAATASGKVYFLSEVEKHFSERRQQAHIGEHTIPKNKPSD